MEKFLNFLRSAWYNAVHDWIYSVFYVAGTAVTFVFVVILLMAARLVGSNLPPYVNAARTVYIPDELIDRTGNSTDGIAEQDIAGLVKSVPGIESYYVFHSEEINASIDGKVRPVCAAFVSHEYFTINEFDFVSGRPFSEDSGQPQAVIMKDIEDRYYRGDALGKKINVQGREYTVAGVVGDYAFIQNPNERANIWLPRRYNIFTPSGWPYYSINVLIAEGKPMYGVRENLCHSITGYYAGKGVTLDLSTEDLKTVRETRQERAGGDLFRYGAFVLLFLMLLTPALNIMALNSANVVSRREEIAVRRALGASRCKSFFEIIFENMLLVFTGLVIAIILVRPVLSIVGNVFSETMSTASVISISGFDPAVAGLSVALAAVFTVLSSGIPAYRVTSGEISESLKGGMK